MHRLVPQFILENFQAAKYNGSLEAVGMLVDVSGFSRMTDTLAQQGPHGSEVLADGMRRVFDPMLEIVFAHGGFVIGFAGDAITALFPAGMDTYLRAAACALRIQKHLLESPTLATPYGQFSVSVKIGLGAGNARWRIVRSTDGKRATYYFRGSAIDQAVRSLHCAKPGDIFLCPTLQRELGNTVETQQQDNFFHLEKIRERLPSPVAFDSPQPEPDLLQVFCSTAINPQEVNAEFRPTVNLFISIPQSNDLQNTTREIPLEPLLQKIFHLQDRYGGLFSHIDFGDKGINLLMFWGAPVAQENDIERALTFFIELMRETGLSIKAGVTYRLAYTGLVGGRLQEEYTCYGWGVNLSARLMTSAEPGEIWVDEEIARHAEKRFNLQLIGQQAFKGFSQEQKVFRLLSRKEEHQAVFSGEFVGRESELETLNSFISPIWSGQFAGMLSVIGDPGIGKSRLINAFQSSPSFTNYSVLWAYCQTDEIVRQSLNPFRYWLRHYFKVSESQGETENKAVFDVKLDALIDSTQDAELSRELERTRSFLGELIDLRWPNSLYEQLDAQGRYENTFIALSTLLRAESLKQPVIILLEDAHLLDGDTRDFLPYLGRALTAADKSYPIAILAIARRGSALPVLEDVPYKEINLTELPASDLAHLAGILLGGNPTPALLNLIEQRAEGNPFFAEQIIRYLREEHKLKMSEYGWQMAERDALENLPTDVSTILIARLDRLNRDVKEEVQTASVLGREFELRLLSKMLHKDETSVLEKTNQAVEAEILAMLSENRYVFQHALLRDAAYNMQLRARQQELHKIATQAFESLYQKQLSPHYSEIAYHAEQAGLIEKARKYYRLAGNEAVAGYHNNLALESYTNALSLTSIEDIQERVELLLAREALFSTIGDRDGQAQDLATLDLLTEKQADNRNRSIVALRHASFAFDTGEYREAETISQNAIAFANLAGADELAVNAYRILPIALARQGKIKAAIQSAQDGIQLAHKTGNHMVEGHILNDLGLITLELRELETTRRHFENSLHIAQETGNRRLEAQVHLNIGSMSGMVEADFSAAKEHYERTLAIVREIGNRIGESFALGNLGWVASMQGDFERARNYQAEALTIARETGNRYQEAYGLINLSAMAVSQEDHPAALAYAEQSLALTRKIGDRSSEAWSLTYLGHTRIGLSEFEDASFAYEEAAAIRRELEQAPLLMEPLAGLANVLLENREYTAALAQSEEILEYLSGGGTLDGAEEPVLIYLTIYKALIANQDPRAIQTLQAGHDLLQKQVDRIQGVTNQQMYVQNVPWRRELMAIWDELNAKE